jgi:hypothetical protein
VIFTSNGLHLVLSISATIGSKRNCAWAVALILGLVEDRNRRNTVLRTFPVLSRGLHLLQEESTFVRSLYEESSQHCRTQRIVRCFLGVFRAIDSSCGSAPFIILKVRDLSTAIPKSGIRKHNDYVI